MKRKVESEVEKSENENKISMDECEIAALIKSGIEKGLRYVRSRRFKEKDSSWSTTEMISSKTLKTLRKFYDDKQTMFKSLK